MDVAGYFDAVRSVYATGKATEHSYRPALAALFASIDPALSVVNEPRRSDVGAPDFIFSRGDVPVGWCEHKDIDKDVVKLKGYSKEQKDRYRRGLPNLLYTNGLDFEFIRDGEKIAYLTIADLMPGLPARPAKFGELEKLLQSFAAAQPISISSAAQLARLMAAKAAIIKDVLGNVLAEDKAFRSSLGGQYRAFKADLLPHLEPGEFADIYAETITYGMFAARLHDTTLHTFSRGEALELLPKSNPFLRSLFGYIAGPDLDDRIAWIVDDLALILRASDPSLLFRDFGKFTARNDPFVHFYEDFLREYNPAKRKSRGVWYTPEPVVDFIVRAVDDVLKTEFGLADGLADTSKVTVNHDTGQNDPKTGKPVTIRKEVHRVQILDPATGTGTFLAKAVQTIAARVKARAPGKWSGYVETDLIPRLHGFELLMASYAMCHMKLDMQLRETGYVPSATPPRLLVWLTNALEEGEREVRDLFFHALAEEASGANEVKRNRPIMCVIGNPPYSGISQNMETWITRLIEDYKYVDGVHFGERKHWLQDDYVKFIRMAEHLIAENGDGVLGFITNHGYLDNPTFRGMRWHLLQSFDAIYVLDLHGNSNKRESNPDGGEDENVFDIQQGVAIVVAVKRTGKRISSLATVSRADFWGSRQAKNELLWSANYRSQHWQSIRPSQPYFMFAMGEDALRLSWEQGFSLSQLFPVNVTGIVTARDALVIDTQRSTLLARLDRFINPSRSEHEVRTEFFGHKTSGKYAAGDTREWKLQAARINLAKDVLNEYVIPVLYRPLDNQYMLYRPDMVDWGRVSVMQHLVGGSNMALLSPRMTSDDYSAFVTEKPILNKAASRYDQTYMFPLYLRANDSSLELGRRLNLDLKIYAAICKVAGLTPSADAGEGEGDAFRTATGNARPTEVKVFDYIYGVLHAPAYRETYAEFLRIDFPRIPYPRDPETFTRVSAAGEALRRLHLLEPAAVGDAPYSFTGEGDDIVASGYPKYDEGAVAINAGQRFEAVPAVAWDFPIGGYRPAQKWLKDRRGRALSWDDVTHYQRIVKVLLETDRIMRGLELPLD